MSRSEQYLTEVVKYSANNYKPLNVVLERGKGAWVWDVDGKKFLDCLSAYSAVNQGHCHPALVKAAKEQLERLTLTSRAFHNDQMGPFLHQLCDLAGFAKALPMNSGAEAVETAIKAIRKWGYKVKGIPANKAEIIVSAGNFHGRTTTIISFSTEEQYKDGFGPLTPGFKIIPFGDADALERAITPNTAAFLTEPLQGEAGVIVAPAGWLKKVREICTRHNVLWVDDEIQTGLGRTGKMFAFQWEGVRPDALIVGKALSGGFYPVSAFIADDNVMGVFKPGDHGSTFGGNPLGAAIGRAALRVLVEEKLTERARELGDWFMAQLRKIDSPQVVEVRGKGLLIGVEIRVEAGTARPFCEALAERGILCKETHDQVVRFAPPLVVAKADLEWALPKIAEVLAMNFQPAVAAAQ
jgi:ornithine--oxo-acid transaminase